MLSDFYRFVVFFVKLNDISPSWLTSRISNFNIIPVEALALSPLPEWFMNVARQNIANLEFKVKFELLARTGWLIWRRHCTMIINQSNSKLKQWRIVLWRDFFSFELDQFIRHTKYCSLPSNSSNRSNKLNVLVTRPVSILFPSKLTHFQSFCLRFLFAVFKHSSKCFDNRHIL